MTAHDRIEKIIEEIVELEITRPITDVEANWRLVELDAELEDLEQEAADESLS